MRKWLIGAVLGCVLVGLGALVPRILFAPTFPEHLDKNAERSARVIRTAIQQWQAANNSTSCPTLKQLVDEKQLDTGQSNTDSWNQPYRFTCRDNQVKVESSGADHRFGTTDDIVMPRSEAR